MWVYTYAFSLSCFSLFVYIICGTIEKTTEILYSKKLRL